MTSQVLPDCLTVWPPSALGDPFAAAVRLAWSWCPFRVIVTPVAVRAQVTGAGSPRVLGAGGVVGLDEPRRVVPAVPDPGRLVVGRRGQATRWPASHSSRPRWEPGRRHRRHRDRVRRGYAPDEAPPTQPVLASDIGSAAKLPADPDGAPPGPARRRWAASPTLRTAEFAGAPGAAEAVVAVAGGSMSAPTQSFLALFSDPARGSGSCRPGPCGAVSAQAGSSTSRSREP